MNRLRRMGIEKVDVLVDVGANRGQFIKEVITEYRPTVIHAVEMLGDAIEAIREWRLGNVFTHHCAVGADYGKQRVQRSLADQASSLLTALPGVGEKYGVDISQYDEGEIAVYPLDNVIPRMSVDLLKIDVQGYELEVLKGAERTLRATKYVVIEMNCIPQYENGSTFGPVYEAMRFKGFTLKNLFAPNCGTDNLLHYDERIILHCDALFVNGNDQL